MLSALSSQPLYNFYPRPPRGGRLRRHDGGKLSMEFLSTPSARRATGSRRCTCPSPRISIHALREEGDRGEGLYIEGTYDFYPRPPRGGRRPAHSSNTLPVQFLSTPSARRAT